VTGLCADPRALLLAEGEPPPPKESLNDAARGRGPSPMPLPATLTQGLVDCLLADGGAAVPAQSSPELDGDAPREESRA